MIYIEKTKDQSFTIRDSLHNETYHSGNGAFTESMHIFINNGLRRYLRVHDLPRIEDKDHHITILEVGFGTGLNTILTAAEASGIKNIHLNYISIEKYPLDAELIMSLRHRDLIGENVYEIYNNIINCPWNVPVEITPGFTLTKQHSDLRYADLPDTPVDIVYYDAFSPAVQPELWSREIFSLLYTRMSNNSLLATYSSRGDVKRALRECGFIVKREKGPPGKRHIIVATKIDYNLSSSI
jgi:tRNA U34 5-methylaminomethyl-2-thiouridine-forming methyltransferase MnmC